MRFWLHSKVENQPKVDLTITVTFPTLLHHSFVLVGIQRGSVGMNKARHAVADLDNVLSMRTWENDSMCYESMHNKEAIYYHAVLHVSPD